MKICVLLLMYLINNTHYNPKPYRYVNKKIAKNVCYYSIKRNLNPKLVLAVISHESGYRYNLRSKTGDIGLMQLHYKYLKGRCNPHKIECNIREGTYKLYMWKKAGNYGNNHWLRRYNWYSKRHHLRILWIAKAFEMATRGHSYLLKYVKKRKYSGIRLNYKCIRENLCGVLRMEE